jgi:hypothetical protein
LEPPVRNARSHGVIAAGLALAILVPLLAGAARPGLAPGPDPQAEASPAKAKVRTEPLSPAPSSLKERSGIVVFLVFMWFSIAVLLYVLRLKKREADRVTSLHPPVSSPPSRGGPSSHGS